MTLSSAQTSMDHDLIIISGLSGSGKSVALQSLEDIGYYCIDNLPAMLLPEFCRSFSTTAVSDPTAPRPGAAVSIDARNQHFLSTLDQTLAALEENNIVYRVLYLDAEETSLVQRYSETRRKHPLTGAATPLLECIRRERLLLQPLLQRAERVVDTTDTTPHELRALIREFSGGSYAPPLFLIESFGFKYGSPREADFVFDVRCLPNPHWQPELQRLTGLDRAVVAFFESHKPVATMTSEIFAFLERWLPGFANENRSYITVGIGCTGGRHRSVYISAQLQRRFLDRGFKVQLRHRELA